MSYGELAETTLVCILNDSAIRFTKTKRTYKSLDSKEGSCRPHLLTDGPCAALGDVRQGHAVVVHGRRGLGCVRVRVGVADDFLGEIHRLKGQEIIFARIETRKVHLGPRNLPG